jgi:demethylmenaquinone methyltransferase/2-methoxy-6-polyprenyl-1,4-benzoquinol methylase
MPPPSARPATLPEGDEKRRAVQSMFDTIAPRYDLVNRIMTFGLDRGWRHRTVSSLTLDQRSRVLDVACGTGDLCLDLADAGYRPLGVDLSAGMLRHARTDAPLVHADALLLPFSDQSLDGLVSGFALRNFVALPPLFAEAHRVLRPGGRMALLDVATPSNPLIRAGHAVYFRRVAPLVGAALSDASAYRYLPRSVAYLPPVAELLAGLRSAGFAAVERRLLSGGITQLLTATRSAE